MFWIDCTIRLLIWVLHSSTHRNAPIFFYVGPFVHTPWNLDAFERLNTRVITAVRLEHRKAYGTFDKYTVAVFTRSQDVVLAL